MAILFFDTETTGLWDKNLPCGHEGQPRIVQLAAMQVDPATRRVLQSINLIVYRKEEIPEASVKVHGTSTEVSQKYGVFEDPALDIFCDMLIGSDLVVAHNIEFDINVINNAARLISGNPVLNVFAEKKTFCTMMAAVPVCKFESKWKRGEYAWPKLELAIPHLLGREPTDAHQAIGDVIDCRDLFFHLYDLKQQAAASPAPE